MKGLLRLRHAPAITGMILVGLLTPSSAAGFAECVVDAAAREFEAKKEGGNKALAVMEQQLSETEFLVNDALTIADISLYAYTHVAHEGGFELSGYPAVLTWLGRVSSHPRHVTMSQAAI